MTDIDWTSEAARRLQARPHPLHNNDPVSPPNVDHQVAPISKEKPERIVVSMGLPRHRPLADIIEGLRGTADEIHNRGAKAIALASELAAKGYAASTLGDGGSRGTDPTSSTERAAGVNQDKARYDRWVGIDRRLAAALAEAEQATSHLGSLIKDITHHAADVDPVPVGTGYCQACNRFCRPDKARPGNRLRSGLCPTDYRAWLRAGQPHHNDWIRTRRDGWTDDNGVVHTPEPDHDIDLSSERLDL